MGESTVHFKQLVATSKQFAHRLLAMGGNRFELLAVEVQEERAHRLHLLLLGVGVGACILLAALTLTAALVVGLWAWSPVAVLLILTVLYGGAAFGLYRWLTRELREWQMFAASLEQFRKDRACLEKILA